MTSSLSAKTNKLLAALPVEVFARWAPLLELVKLRWNTA